LKYFRSDQQVFSSPATIVGKVFTALVGNRVIEYINLPIHQRKGAEDNEIDEDFAECERQTYAEGEGCDAAERVEHLDLGPPLLKGSLELKEVRKKIPEGPGFVYITSDRVNRFKVGSSRDPKQRWRGFRVSSIDIQLRWALPVLARFAAEAVSHEALKQFNITGQRMVCSFRLGYLHLHH
jgi:hypothetical protein